jgi:DNA modification methylase
VSESFLNGRVILRAGDSRDVLKTLADNSIDSIVTDPPYALVSIGKRYGKSNMEQPIDKDLSKINAGSYRRLARGFMGKTWDTGETVESVDFWAECLRVLKPGGHVAAFSGTRTYHRMACAIEDAGFEIRDMLSWLYGSGFPKSHDVSKGIDEHFFQQWLDANPAQREQYNEQIRQAGKNAKARDHVRRKFRKAAGVAGSKGSVVGKSGSVRNAMAGDFAGGEYHEYIPGNEAAQQWQGWGTALKPACEPICFGRKPLSEKTVAANVLAHGTGAINIGACRVSASGHTSDDSSENTAPSRTDDRESHTPNKSRRGTSSPQHASSETLHLPNATSNDQTAIAPQDFQGDCPTYLHLGDEQSRQYADGDLASAELNGDVHVSRDHPPKPSDSPSYQSNSCADAIKKPVQLQGRDGEASAERRYTENGSTNFAATPGPRGGSSAARWPANVIHDGSDEVVAAFPETGAAKSGLRGEMNSGRHGGLADLGGNINDGTNSIRGIDDDGGSAARFFYSSKADSDDRLGSKHPTVKPVDLMQWLCRLVTPPGGTILDCFAGTGTTGEAAFREGFNAVLIEREPEYQADIRRRMALCMSGPDERARESIKARNFPVDHGPLFAGAE